MDKLIDYEGLGNFREILVNDSSISEKSTWSSEKISDELVDMTTALATKQNTLTPGKNIFIDNTNTIFAMGYQYFESRNSFVELPIGNNSASGNHSHAEGYLTEARGNHSHTEGHGAITEGLASHAEGRNTRTKNEGEHAEGIGNKSHKSSDNLGDAGNTEHSVGIANSYLEIDRKNAVEIMQNGDTYVLGVGGYDGVHIKNEDPSINVQTLQEYILSLEARIYALEHPTTVE